MNNASRNDIAGLLHDLANRLPTEASWDDFCHEVETLS